jgi:Asp/Glu/hydantoin racemase
MFNFAQTYTYTTTSSSSGVSGVVMFLYLLLIVVYVVANWKIFEKAGQAGWKSLIPIYNFVIMLRIVGMSGWYALLLLVPLVNIVFAVIVLYKMAVAFGYGVGMTILELLFGIGSLIIGFGSAKYLGPDGHGKKPATVVACNTVTTNLISQLRQEFKVPMIGMEPMVKPAAAATKSGIITVCATPRTLSSERYQWLKNEYAKGIEVLEPDCSDWAMMIESNTVDREKIAKIVQDSINQGSDQIVLGCTHYHWIEEEIRELAGNKAQVIQPETAVIAQLKRVLAQLV